MNRFQKEYLKGFYGFLIVLSVIVLFACFSDAKVKRPFYCYFCTGENTFVCDEGNTHKTFAGMLKEIEALRDELDSFEKLIMIKTTPGPKGETIYDRYRREKEERERGAE
jgi:hypothetical protein